MNTTFIRNSLVAGAVATALLFLVSGTAHATPRDCHVQPRSAACAGVSTGSPNERGSLNVDPGGQISLGGPDTLPQQHNWNDES
jgi:hypothetical protein